MMARSPPKANKLSNIVPTPSILSPNHEKKKWAPSPASLPAAPFYKHHYTRKRIISPGLAPSHSDVSPTSPHQGHFINLRRRHYHTLLFYEQQLYMLASHLVFYYRSCHPSPSFTSSSSVTKEEQAKATPSSTIVSWYCHSPRFICAWYFGLTLGFNLVLIFLHDRFNSPDPTSFTFTSHAGFTFTFTFTYNRNFICTHQRYTDFTYGLF